MRSDEDLMMDLQTGGEEAFEMLVKRHQVGLLNFFYRLVWSRDLAEDLTQEVFCKLYMARQTYEPRAKFTTFLYRVARNRWIDHLRRTRNERRTMSLDAELSDDGGSLRESLAGPAESPSQATHRRELLASIAEAVDSLPEAQKLVFILGEVKGMKYDEIADTLEIPIGTVKSRMHGALLHLRERLKSVGPVRREIDR